ncbi:MAG TPA: archaetidylserine decarboxylase [Gammaproteobacteria bacterium]|nr:archaetidylserine decarboxylase [Gammaproteobacteria bacterium]
MTDYLKTLPQYLLPQHLLSRLMYLLTRVRWQPWKNWQIRWFIRRYQVDMGIALQPDPIQYPTFNSFFTRALHSTARPVVSGAGEIACPVDGTVSQAGKISESTLFQAKGHSYTLERLLGGPVARAAPFKNGRFATLYLAPKDYHRIHMPLRGQLCDMTYVPGRLFSVNTRTARAVPRLFARNERVITIFDTEAGPMAVILVGALFVGSMETVWEGTITPPYGRSVHTWDYRRQEAGSPIILERGQELGRFNMGSTVIVLFGPNQMDWDSAITEDAPTRMGQLLGRLRVISSHEQQGAVHEIREIPPTPLC